MTFREKIADWISGGEVTKARWRSYDCILDAANAEADADWFKLALRAIAAMETPSANATVKRMAKAAREALE